MSRPAHRAARTSRSRRARLFGLALAAIAGLAAGCGAAADTVPAGSSQPAVWASATAAADDGAKIVGVTRLSERMVDLTIESPAMGGRTTARLTLPVGFDSEPDRRWPLLYMLHGAQTPDALSSFTRHPEVETMIGDAGVLVVTPYAGDYGYYSDWYNGGKGGPPKWETYHLTELPQLLERNWHAGGKRAVVGLSMGGFGAMSYAARHPGMFVAAASLSGVLDTSQMVFRLPDELWGQKGANLDVWEAHNPKAQAEGLRGTKLYVAYGNGQPGPLDPAGTTVDDLETGLKYMNDAFAARLRSLGIEATVDAYGPGTHTWPYWSRALGICLPMLIRELGA